MTMTCSDCRKNSPVIKNLCTDCYRERWYLSQTPTFPWLDYLRVALVAALILWAVWT